MAKKYLDENGLLYFWQKIKAKFVESVSYDTTNHKIVQTKNGASSDIVSASTLKTDMGLGSVQNGAEVNQNAFSNVKVGSTTVSADTKTDTLELIAGSNVTLTPNATDDAVTISATDTTYPTLAEADITTGTATTPSVVTAKVIHDYVDANGGDIDTIKRNGTALTITNKEVDMYVPIETADKGKYIYAGTSTTDSNYDVLDVTYKPSIDGTSSTKRLLTSDWANLADTQPNPNGTDKSIGSDISLDYTNNSVKLVFDNGWTTNWTNIGTATTRHLYNRSRIFDPTDDKEYFILENSSTKFVIFNVTGNVITYITWLKSGTVNQGVKTTETLQDEISDLDTIRGGASAGATAYQKPSTGIPSSDMASAVQTSLGLADTALQKKSTAGIVYSSANSTTTSSATASQIVSAIGNTAVNRATADASGNTITTTYAPLASPALTGTPTAPTASAGTNTTQIATTAFVTSAIATAQTGSATFQGTISSNTTLENLSTYTKGMYWVVDTAGTYVGQTCEPGDMIFCVSDRASAYSASDFSVVQNNLDLVPITNAEIDAIVA